MQVFKIRGMTCAHCERAVIQAIQALDPVARVQVDLAEGEVELEGALDGQEIRNAIAE